MGTRRNLVNHHRSVNHWLQEASPRRHMVAMVARGNQHHQRTRNDPLFPVASISILR